MYLTKSIVINPRIAVLFSMNFSILTQFVHPKDCYMPITGIFLESTESTTIVLSTLVLVLLSTSRIRIKIQ